MARIGYIRVSTDEQNTARQDTMMESLNADKVFTDKASGSTAARPGLKSMLEYVREGDTVIVESISRLARSTRDLLSIMEKLKEKGVGFISQKEAIDTETAQGRFMLTVFGAIAELERENILQRQREGIAEAKKAGKYKGRKRIEIDELQFAKQYEKWKRGEQTAREAMKKLCISAPTFYRRVKEFENNK